MRVSDTIDSLYKSMLAQVLEEGSESSPRGYRTLEVLGAHHVLTRPDFNVLTLPRRRANYHFMVAEWLWMVSGSNFVGVIEPFNKNITIAQDEGQASFAGSYGPKIVEQLPYVLDTLRFDPDSRQAVIGIWRERPRASRDVPCTLSLQFMVRPSRKEHHYGSTIEEPVGSPALYVVATMRSNDGWLGVPYDVFNFTQLQRLVARELGVMCGDYHHVTGSLHLYEKHWVAARELLADPVKYTPMLQMPFVGTVFDVPRIGAALADLATGHTRGQPWVMAWWDRHKDEPQTWRDLLAVLGSRFTTGIEPPPRWHTVMRRDK